MHWLPSKPALSSFLGVGFFVLLAQSATSLARQLQLPWSCNPGIGWGIILPPLIAPLASWGSIAIIFFFLLWSVRIRWGIDWVLGLILLLAGGLSNGLDRLRIGCVIDYLLLPLWPRFNVADVMIVTGAIIIVMAILHPIKRNNS